LLLAARLLLLGRNRDEEPLALLLVPLSLAGLLPLAWAVVLVLFIVPLVLAQE
jgi:hypothetical protein